MAQGGGYGFANAGIVRVAGGLGFGQLGGTPVVAIGEADAGTPFGFDDGSHNSYGFATELPSASYVAGELTSHANVDTFLGASGASVFGAGTQGAANPKTASGEQEYLSTTGWVLDGSQLTGDIIIGLLDTQTVGSFDTLKLFVDVVGSQDFHESFSFTSLGAAQPFFTDQALDIGSFTSAPGVPVTVSITVDLFTNSPGSGFGIDYLLGVAPPNAPTVTTVPGPQLVQQGIATPISGISVADADASTAGEIITVVLSDSTGLLTATVAGVTESGTTLTISGTLAQVNADLGTLSLKESAPGSDAIDVATSDGRGGNDDHKIAVSTNSPPVTTVPAFQLTQQGIATRVSGLSVADSDANTAGETITVVLSDTNGLLAATGTGVSPSGPTQLTITGTLAQVNAELGTLTLQEITLAPDTIDVATSDGRGGSDDHKIAVSVNAAPVANNDSYDALHDRTLQIDAAHGVLANDSDVDSDKLTAVPNTAPSFGSLSLNPDGSFTYTPNHHFVGTDSFTYFASDGSSETLATATINVSRTGAGCGHGDL
jgi:VCBS repeat-containing protein